MEEILLLLGDYSIITQMQAPMSVPGVVLSAALKIPVEDFLLMSCAPYLSLTSYARFQ